MVKILRKLWQIFNNIAYSIIKSVLGIFNISISDEKWLALMQFVKFGLVGVVNTFIDYFSYLIALNIFNFFHLFGDKAYIPSNFIGLSISVINAFYWNDKYVFKKEEGKERSKALAFVKTVSSYAATGLFLKTILLYLFITVLGISDVIAPIIIMFIVVPVNFTMNKLWAFKNK